MRTIITYDGLSDIVLRRELKRRKYKARGKMRKDIILLLEEDDKTQERIVWEPQRPVHQVQQYLTRGGGEEEGGGDATPNTGEDEEDLWEEVEPGSLIADGMKAEEGTDTRPSIGRKSPLGGSGRLTGRGRRGFWVRRKEELLKKSLKSDQG